jgi:hypothetical protein
MMNARITQAAQLMAASAPLDSIFGCIVGQARGGEVNSIRGALNSMLITLDRGGKKKIEQQNNSSPHTGQSKAGKALCNAGLAGEGKTCFPCETAA